MLDSSFESKSKFLVLNSLFRFFWAVFGILPRSGRSIGRVPTSGPVRLCVSLETSSCCLTSLHARGVDLWFFHASIALKASQLDCKSPWRCRLPVVHKEAHFLFANSQLGGSLCGTPLGPPWVHPAGFDWSFCISNSVGNQMGCSLRDPLDE